MGSVVTSQPHRQHAGLLHSGADCLCHGSCPTSLQPRARPPWRTSRRGSPRCPCCPYSRGSSCSRGSPRCTHCSRSCRPCCPCRPRCPCCPCCPRGPRCSCCPRCPRCPCSLP